MGLTYENFISYRRSNSAVETKTIYDELKHRGLSVFCDVYELGVCKFDNELIEIIKNCTNFILILKDDSLDRCKNHDDWVRKEILTAIENKKNIICIFVNDFKFPNNLPIDIRLIENCNGISYDIIYFTSFVDKLIRKFIEPNIIPQQSNAERDFVIENGNLIKYVGNATHVTIPEGIIKIGKSAFKDQTKIEKIYLPESLSIIGESAFERCLNLQFIDFPKNLLEIENYAFSRCYNLSSVEFNTKLEVINDYAFSFCNKIKLVTLGQNIKIISPTAFTNCPQLYGFIVNENNKYFTSNNNLLFDKNLNTILRCPEGYKNNSIILPESVLKIGEFAFFRCTNLVNISLPTRISEICQYAFKDCFKIITLSLHDEIQHVDETAFDGWTIDQRILFCGNFNPLIKYKITELILKTNKQNQDEVVEAEYILVITTFESEKEARSIANALLDKNLIVSAQLIDITSIYTWENSICDEKEWQLQLITKGNQYNSIEQFIEEHHSYDLCELMCIPINRTSLRFGNWISKVINKKKE